MSMASTADLVMPQGVDFFGQPVYVEQEIPVNPELCKQIASMTGGMLAWNQKSLPVQQVAA